MFQCENNQISWFLHQSNQIACFIKPLSFYTVFILVNRKVLNIAIFHWRGWCLKFISVWSLMDHISIQCKKSPIYSGRKTFRIIPTVKEPPLWPSSCKKWNIFFIILGILGIWKRHDTFELFPRCVLGAISIGIPGTMNCSNHMLVNQENDFFATKIKHRNTDDSLLLNLTIVHA